MQSTTNIYNKNKPWIEKYRPIHFSDVKGQTLVKDTILNMIKKGFFPNMIFHGSPGTGKTSFIFSLANLIYEQHIDTLTLELNASDDRGINVIRDEIKDFTSKKNLFTNGIKLVILDEADAMTPEAQLALRYLMEKYRDQVRFCLICNYYYKIIDSIKSRCCVFRFLPLDKKDTKTIIKHIMKEEKYTLSPSIINKIISFGKGDIRKSINLLQSVCLTNNKINSKFVNLLIGDIEDTDSTKIFEYINNNKITYRKKLLLIKKFIDSYGISLSNLIKIIFEKLHQDKLSNKMSKLAELEFQVKQSTFSKTYLYQLIAIFHKYDLK